MGRIFYNRHANHAYAQQYYMQQIAIADLGGTTPMVDDLTLIEAPCTKSFGVFIDGELLEKLSSFVEAKAVVKQLKEYETDFLENKEVRVIRLDNKTNFHYNSQNRG